MPLVSGLSRTNTARKRKKSSASDLITKERVTESETLPTGILEDPDGIGIRHLDDTTSFCPAYHRPDDHTEYDHSVHNSRLRTQAQSHSRSESESESSSSASPSLADSDHELPTGPTAKPDLTRSTTTPTANHSAASLFLSRNKSYNSLPRSLSSAHLTNFAPPFYNRPPTPLPPSPSLTSLLRPTFSATPSRPTTPDDSDADQHTSSTRTPSLAGLSTTTTGTADATQKHHLLNTARTAQPLPRASPKVPTYEYYGFVLYLTSSLFFLGYVLWSYLPSPFLHQLGIYYYPDRWWSLAIPAWIVMAVGFVYVGLAGYNVEVLTLPLGSLGTIVDEVGVVAVIDEKTGRMINKRAAYRAAPDEHEGKSDWSYRDCWNESTDAVLDVPVGGVCEVLYGD